MKQRRFLLITLFIFLFALMQSTFLPSFKIMGTIPDLVILFVILIGLYNGSQEGVLSGIISGIVLGYFSSGYMGIFCFGYGMAGFISGLVREKMHPGNFVIPMIVAVTLTFLSSFMVVILGLSFGILVNLAGFRAHILPLLLLNILLVIPMGYLVRSRLITSRRLIE